jgi:hypothetical protein
MFPYIIRMVKPAIGHYAGKDGKGVYVARVLVGADRSPQGRQSAISTIWIETRSDLLNSPCGGNNRFRNVCRDSSADNAAGIEERLGREQFRNFCVMDGGLSES